MRLTWPEVPEPWSNKVYWYNCYRRGYRSAYREERAKEWQDPRSIGAQAYFAGWAAGLEARDSGVIYSSEEEPPVPSKYTAGDTRKAYRSGFKIGAAIEVVSLELYQRNRNLFTGGSWGAGTAFDAGWKAGLKVNPHFAGQLPPPVGPPVALPPPFQGSVQV